MTSVSLPTRWIAVFAASSDIAAPKMNKACCVADAVGAGS